MERNEHMQKSKIAEKSRLGRGLSALIPPSPRMTSVPEINSAPQSNESETFNILEVALSSIVPNSLQPRTEFDALALDDLAASIAKHGLLQPIMVRQRGPNRYELIAGERRFRAAEKAGLTHIPVVIREMSDKESLTVALIENIQREDLNAIEAARGYRQLLNEFDLTQTELAQQIGKSQSTIAHALSLLKLPIEIQESISEGKITTEHGKVLLGIDDNDLRLAIWREIIRSGLSVVESRRLAAAEAMNPTSSIKRQKTTLAKDVHWRALEDRLRSAIGLKVSLRSNLKGHGTLTIDFSNSEEIEGFLEKIS